MLCFQRKPLPKRIRISLYWKCQLIGWSLAALYWQYAGYLESNFSWALAVLHFFGDLLINIVPTHLFRNFSLKMGWHKLAIPQLLLRLIPSILLLGSIYTLLTISKNHLVRIMSRPDYSFTLLQDFERDGLVVWVAGIRLMAIWLLAYYGYQYAQRELSAVKEAARLSLMAKDAQFNQLSAQLNPHFFFNSLNSIKALVIENPSSARRAIDLLSDLLRTSLYGRETGLIPLQEEMALVKDYLELEKIRFEEKLQTKLSVDPQLSNAAILPLSIQVLVENAIKHGIAKTKGGGRIEVDIKTLGDTMRVTVMGPGLLENNSVNGLGLNNLRERLSLQYHQAAKFIIEQRDPHTVIASIIIPIS